MKRTFYLMAILLALLLLLCSGAAHATPTPTPQPTPDPCGPGWPGSGWAYSPAPGLCAKTVAIQDHAGLAVWAQQGDHVVVGVWRQGSTTQPMPEFGPAVVLLQGQSRTWFLAAQPPAGDFWYPDIAEVWRLWLPLAAR